MIKKIFSVVLLLLFSTTWAQYTELINSNKPGFSESPYSVGTGIYQFESSFFHRNASAIPTFSNPRATGLELHYRMGLLDEFLELSLTTALQQNEFAFLNVFESSRSEFGFGKFTLGAKYLVYKPKYKDKSKEIRSWKERHSFDWSRWIPHVAVYGGINFGSFLSDYHARGGITPKLGVLLQNEFSHKLNVITNIHYNYIGGYLPEFSYVVTGTYNFTDKWSGFVEQQSLFNKQESQSNFGFGAAYLFNRDLQINSSLRATFQENSTGIYTSIGVSYRINNHVDKFVELDEFGNKIEGDELQTYNKGFFGRVIDKIKNLFKKKDKTGPQLETDKTEEELEKQDEGRVRVRQKSVLGDITKKDEKAKKKTTKEKEKAAKKKKKDEEKAKKKLEKEKEKEEKRKKKEQEKLEKEIKKLEEELKKEEEKEKKEEKEKEEKDNG